MKTIGKNLRLLTMIVVAGATAITGLVSASSLTFTGKTITGVNLAFDDAVFTNGYFFSGCYSPVNIKMNNSDTDTTAIDVKMLFSGTFDFQETLGTTGYTGFEEGVFETYLTFTGINRDSRLGTGSANSGVNQGDTYHYINARNTRDNPINSGNADVATIYVKPTGTTGVLDFYLLLSGSDPVNSDDSNISSGFNKDTQTTGYTQYKDSLYIELGTGEYTITTTNLHQCPFKPYILFNTSTESDNAHYDSKLGQDLATGVVNKDDTSMASLAGYDISNPAGPQYLGTITHAAGYDYTTGDYTNTGTWEIWTNTSVVLTFKANDNELIRLETGTFASDYLSLSGYAGGFDSWTNDKTVIITGNIETGITFYNQIGNDGNRYQSGSDNYFSEFMIDVFWYDTKATTVSTGTIATGGGFETIYLSGSSSIGVSNETNGWHADFTDDDDRFRIIKFSGTNSTGYGYSSITGYNEVLNDNYVQGSDQDFRMLFTGTNAITFNQSWSGYVYYSDIAGNVSGVRVDVEVDSTIPFIIHAKPAFREKANDLVATGDLWIAQSLDNGSTWTFLHNSDVDSQSGFVLNNNGTGLVNIKVPTSGSQFLATIKGSGMLSIGFTGTWNFDSVDSSGNIITGHLYFDSGAKNNSANGGNDVRPELIYDAEDYMKAGDVEFGGTGNNYDLVSVGLDLSTTNNRLTLGFNSSEYADYFDFDLNDVISAIEQAIIIQFDTQKGFVREYSRANPIGNLQITGFTTIWQ